MSNSFKPILAFLDANKHQKVADVLPAVVSMCDVMSIDSVKLPDVESEPRVEVGNRGYDDRDEVVRKMVQAFSQKKDASLMKKGRSRYCDSTGKVLQVYCAFSKRYGTKQQGHFWYAVMAKPLHFLQEAKDGYLLFGMAGESKMAFLSIKEFVDVQDKLNPYYSQGKAESDADGWHVQNSQGKRSLCIEIKRQRSASRPFGEPAGFVVSHPASKASSRVRPWRRFFICGLTATIGDRQPTNDRQRKHYARPIYHSDFLSQRRAGGYAHCAEARVDRADLFYLA